MIDNIQMRLFGISSQRCRDEHLAFLLMLGVFESEDAAHIQAGDLDRCVSPVPDVFEQHLLDGFENNTMGGNCREPGRTGRHGGYLCDTEGERTSREMPEDV